MRDNRLRQRVRDELFALQDVGYQDFLSKLVPTISKDRIIGVRTPAMRAYVKAYPEALLRDYLALLPHQYFEENSLHGALIGRLKDYDEALQYTQAFLPYVDNWATCDSFQVPVLQKNPERFIPQLQAWLKSQAPYTVRYAITQLMGRYLDKHFHPDMIGWVCAIHSDEYYINMAIGWYLCEALIKQYELALPRLEAKTLPRGAHNTAIQKAIESRRVSEERKAMLRSLKIK